MKTNDQHKVPVNYESYNGPIKSQRPTVYGGGAAYFCVSIPSLLSGVFGVGRTPHMALKSWARAWRELKRV